MKNTLLILCSILLLGCSPDKKELYKITDNFVEKLHTKYESYGIMGGSKHTTYTKNRHYKVMPIGRLINVRIEKVVEKKKYQDLKKDLERHYRRDQRVNDVYISKGGTIMIDCRN